MRFDQVLSIVSLLIAAACSSPKASQDQNQSPSPEKSEQVAPKNIENQTENQPETELPPIQGPGFNEPEPIPSASLSNYQQISAAIGASAGSPDCSNTKIAVLDNGFAGLNSELGKTLPPNARVEDAPKNQEKPEPHGTRMAQIIHALCSGSPTFNANSPKVDLKLYNTNGLTNLKHAVDDAIATGVSLILYSQVWEYGGNLDGAGFINQIVNKATDAGIVWVNAAGNYAYNTYRGRIQRRLDGSIPLPFQGQFIRLKVSEDQTPVKLVLGWNDFSDDFSYRSAQDLDIIIQKASGERIASSELVQDGYFRETQEGGFTRHAREIINVQLNAGEYYIKLKAKSDNFGPSSRFHIVASGYKTELIDRTEDRAVMIPADNQRVIAVGAIDYVGSSRRNALYGQPAKPDVYAPSEVSFTDGMKVRSTSTAAAVAAAAIAGYMSATGARGFEQISYGLEAGTISRFASRGELWQACLNSQQDGLTCTDPYNPSHTPKVISLFR